MREAKGEKIICRIAKENRVDEIYFAPTAPPIHH